MSSNNIGLNYYKSKITKQLCYHLQRATKTNFSLSALTIR